MRRELCIQATDLGETCCVSRPRPCHSRGGASASDLLWRPRCRTKSGDHFAVPGLRPGSGRARFLGAPAQLQQHSRGLTTQADHGRNQSVAIWLKPFFAQNENGGATVPQVLDLVATGRLISFLRGDGRKGGYLLLDCNLLGDSLEHSGYPLGFH